MTDKLDSVYAELLNEFNIKINEKEIQDPAEESINLDATLRCCGEITVSQGGYVCTSCGKVLQQGVIESDYHCGYAKIYRHESQKPLGGDEHWYTERKRRYHPKTHFKQHLNCYLGARNRKIPGTILNALKKKICVTDPEAFNQVRCWLKAHHKFSYYKDTFTILYRLGAPIPTFTKVTEIMDDFSIWYNNFTGSHRFGGHNTPSMQMLLMIFLKRHGHEPFYNIPELKSKKLRDRVYEIDKQVYSGLEDRMALYDVQPLTRKGAPV